MGRRCWLYEGQTQIQFRSPRVRLSSVTNLQSSPPAVAGKNNMTLPEIIVTVLSHNSLIISG